MVKKEEQYVQKGSREENERIPGIQTFTFDLLDPVTSVVKGNIHFIGSTFTDQPDNKYIAEYASIVTEKGIVMYNYVSVLTGIVPMITKATYVAGYPVETFIYRTYNPDTKQHLVDIFYEE